MEQPPVPAPRIVVNPHLQQCPDYAAPEFAEIVAGYAHADPVPALQAAWQAHNERLQIAWNAQVKADRLQGAPPGGGNIPPIVPPQHNAGGAVPHAPPHDAPIDEDLLAFDEGAEPVGHIIDKISPYGRGKLKKMELLYLWYCLPEGMKATRLSGSVSEGYGLVTDEDGVQFKRLNDLKACSSALPDDQLTWSQVLDARTVFLPEISALGWPLHIVNAFHALFYNLELHDARKLHLGPQILVQYQADARREFHDCLEAKQPLFNIAVISDTLMAQCISKVQNKAQERNHAQQQDQIHRLPQHLLVWLSGWTILIITHLITLVYA
ncbi:hypothetical protein EUX98_g9408 [Antrodiella citrinella]|uniref:Uncharacterized protein n=1 Tax=Antrodiella citrinella TaxID=2447956 RepID=A0A4S4LTM6_9APHY|nr:hypothetical protein EUX98_g9408 [Antrodiella citrinella]